MPCAVNRPPGGLGEYIALYGRASDISCGNLARNDRCRLSGGVTSTHRGGRILHFPPGHAEAPSLCDRPVGPTGDDPGSPRARQCRCWSRKHVVVRMRVRGGTGPQGAAVTRATMPDHRVRYVRTHTRNAA
jgi:hypothetical protein